MRPPSDAERLAVMETTIPWIKESLERLELGQKEFHKSLEGHIRHHNWGPGGQIPGYNGNPGVTVMISRKALGFLALVPLGTGAGGVGVLLKYLGVI